MPEPITERVTAEREGDFVVFRLGLRINTLWKLYLAIPIILANFRMLEALENDPDSGLLGYDRKLGIRNFENVQYWRSFEDLREWALDPDAEHQPNIKWTNEQMAESAAVGIYHETYLAREGTYETVYYNMPPTGLGKAGEIQPAEGRRRTAAGRLGRHEPDEAASEDEGSESGPVHPAQLQ